MKKEILLYLQKRSNRLFLYLTIVAFGGFCVLFFKPYYILDWVMVHQVPLFWAEIGVLTLMVVSLLVNISNLKSEQEKLAHNDNENEMLADRQMFNFYDERGDIKLSAKPEMVYYIESADNYVQIHYSNAGKMQTLMLRNSLKNIEWRFSGTPLIRCHRSYLVNLSKVKMVRRIENDMVLDFDENQLPVIPVSKAYADHIVSYFAK